MDTAKILIATHQKLIADAITVSLKEEDEFELIGNIDIVECITDYCEENKPDIIIMDLDNPKIDEIRLIQDLTDQFPTIRILALSDRRSRRLIREVFKAGGFGFLSKTCGRRELNHALTMLKQGNQYICSEAMKGLVEDLPGGQELRGDEDSILTDREHQILELICQELTNREIAEKLQISVRTVDAHRRNLLQKTGSKNTVGLVKYAVKEGILHPG